MHLHIDGDLLVYRCGFAAEKCWYVIRREDGTLAKEWQRKKDVPEDLHPVVLPERRLEPVENALHNVKSMVQTICAELRPSDYTVYLSGPDNFRDGIAKIREYKGNRDPDHKPTHGPAIKEYMHKKYTTVVSEAEEADDTLAWNHMVMYREDPYGSVVVSTDKDLDMIPGLHWNFLREEGYFVDEAYAMYVFYKQLISGDATDNIVGIPGLGETKAARLLKDVPHEEDALYKVVKDRYKEAYKADWRDALLENGQLLWIRRNQDETWTLPEERQ